MTRRSFILAGLLLLSANRWMRTGWAGTASSGSGIVKIQKTREEWRTLLTPEQYHVLREAGTEAPHSSPLLKIKEKGLYVCAGCDWPLFSSEMKYDSHTGWPSFYTTIPGRVETQPDDTLFYQRTEYHCARCGGHQGHLFEKEGPPPTYQRWCNNGLALKFISAS